MNRLKYLKYTIVGVLLLSFAGCNEVLEDVSPSTAVEPEVVLSSPDGIEGIRNSMYAKIHQSFAYRTEYFVAPSAFTDETRNRPGSTRYQGLTQAVGTAGTDHIASWGAHYNVIQDANLIINVDEGILPAPTENQFRGEALGLRAFAMHNLVKVFGYNPGMFDMGPESNWDEGVVIRTEPVFTQDDADQRPRSSVNDVYNQIFADLTEAKSLLSVNNAPNNTFVTEAFIDGLKARAHLYAGNWGEAAQAAQDAITNSGRSLADTPDGVANMFDEGIGNHPEALFKVVVNPDTEGGGFNNEGPGTYTSDGFLAQIPTQYLVDKYDEDDYRMGWYRDCAEAQRVALNQPTGCTAVNDAGYSLVKFNGAKGQVVDDLPYMRLAEMYLIWAEAAARDANSPASGVQPLQELLDARNAGTVPATALVDMTAFEDFILDERMRELALEGHRFFDLKRMGRDIRNPDGSIKMRADSYRILPQLGSGLRNVNPLLVENPGY